MHLSNAISAYPQSSTIVFWYFAAVPFGSVISHPKSSRFVSVHPLLRISVRNRCCPLRFCNLSPTITLIDLHTPSQSTEIQRSIDEALATVMAEHSMGQRVRGTPTVELGIPSGQASSYNWFRLSSQPCQWRHGRASLLQIWRPWPGFRRSRLTFCNRAATVLWHDSGFDWWRRYCITSQMSKRGSL